jgi:hypothetical protein
MWCAVIWQGELQVVAVHGAAGFGCYALVAACVCFRERWALFTYARLLRAMDMLATPGNAVRGRLNCGNAVPRSLATNSSRWQVPS